MVIAAVSSGLKPPKRKLHFTLVDLKATAFARDLLIFRMLFGTQTQTVKQREETNIVISYVFAAQLMPSWASDILHGAMAAIIAELEDLSSNVMGIFYIPEPARQDIARVLKEWQKPPEPWYTTAALRRNLSQEREIREMEQSALFGDLEPENGKVPPRASMTSISYCHQRILCKSTSLAWLKSTTRIARRRLKSITKFSTIISIQTGGPTSPSLIWSSNARERTERRESLTSPGLLTEFPRNCTRVSHPKAAHCPPGLLSYIHKFFDLVGASIGCLKSGPVIEVVHGEMNDVLERLRHGLLRLDQKPVKKLDPSRFPEKIDNIDVINIP